MIRLGDIGAKVKRLQEQLSAAGYTLSLDGVFGKNTLFAVRAFQQATGLKTDGIVGSKTKEALNSCLLALNSHPPKTEHFSIEEFISPKDDMAMAGGVPLIYWKNIQTLMERLESLRRAVGYPLVIRSGYRSPTHNRNVGGATRSQHLYGKAADIYVKDYAIRCYDLAKIIDEHEDLRVLFGGLGLGSVKNVHVDIRSVKNPKKPTTWWYTYKSWKAWSRT